MMPVTLSEMSGPTLRLRMDWLNLNARYQTMVEARERVQSGRLVVTYRERWVIECEISRLYHELCRYLPEVEER